MNVGTYLHRESKEVATMLLAEPNALDKQAENEKSPSPTSSIC